MAKIYPIVKKVTIVAGGDADIIWTEVMHDRDVQKDTLALPDVIHHRDVQKDALVLPDTLHILDNRIVPVITAAYPDKIFDRDKLIGSLSLTDPARTGTTDNNIWVDAWIDGVALNNGNNHGNESPIIASDNTLITTEKDAVGFWDLTRWVNCTTGPNDVPGRPVGTKMNLQFSMNQGFAAVQTVDVICSKKAAKPWAESTVNWNTAGANTDGTNSVTNSISVLVGAVNVRYNIDLTQAQADNFLGSYLYVRARSSALLATPINIASREATTVADRPSIIFTFQR